MGLPEGYGRIWSESTRNQQSFRSSVPMSRIRSRGPQTSTTRAKLNAAARKRLSVPEELLRRARRLLPVDNVSDESEGAVEGLSCNFKFDGVNVGMACRSRAALRWSSASSKVPISKRLTGASRAWKKGRNVENEIDNYLLSTKVEKEITPTFDRMSWKCTSIS